LARFLTRHLREAGIHSETGAAFAEVTTRVLRSTVLPGAAAREAKGAAMLFMVIERLKDRDAVPVYRRVRDEGRQFPEGLGYVGSWVEPNFDRCFQLMECDDLRLLQEWILRCRGSGVTFEIVPVVPSAETRAVVAPFLDRD
jgi:hypothetical protein